MSVARLHDRTGGRWLEARGGYRLAGSARDVRRIALHMREAGARLVAIVGVPGMAGELMVYWSFDLEGTLLWLEASVEHGTPVPSIVDIYPGADWAERETRDYHGVEFAGRGATEPLMLREGDAPGVLVTGRGDAE